MVDNFGNRMSAIHSQSVCVMCYRSEGDMELLLASAKYKGESATPVLGTFYRRCYRIKWNEIEKHFAVKLNVCTYCAVKIYIKLLRKN